EKEKDYPDFVVESQRNFQLVKSIVEANQASGRLRGGDSALVALSAWGIIHGFLMLLLEGQISHAVLEKMSLRELVEFQLEQIKVK
ncbi:MAG TPA: hypothetical protein PLD33_18975, partial [Anaerolineales bacterium]|nr:hypothetical protein [Anaerolineales bacterium]